MDLITDVHMKRIVRILMGALFVLQACAGVKDEKEEPEGVEVLKAYIEGMEWPCFVNINERTEFIVKTEIPSYLYGIEFSTTYDKYYVDPNNKAGTYPWNAVLPTAEWLQVSQTDGQTYIFTITDTDQAVHVMLMFADIKGNKGPGVLFLDKD